MIKPSRLPAGRALLAGLALCLSLMIAVSVGAVPMQISGGTGSSLPIPDRTERSGFSTYGVNTTVPGGIVSGAWTLAGSPYEVEGTITVPDDSTLTIEPGVQVVFSGNYQFIVHGRLTAVGTESDSILFTASDPVAGWGGLRLESAHVLSRVEYCRFELGWAQGAFPDNCGGAIYMNGAVQSISHCSFADNQAALYGGAVYLWGGAPQFAYNLFTKNLALSPTGANGKGHALYVGNCPGLLLNHLTLAENMGSPATGFDLYGATTNSLQMRNSIVWDSYSFVYNNGEVDFTDLASNSTATPITTEILNGMGEGNFSRQPHFMDQTGGDLRLEVFSPCIDGAAASSPWSNEPEPNGERADMGAFANSSKASASLPLASFTADTLDLVAPSLQFGLQKINTMGQVAFQLYNPGRLNLELTGLEVGSSLFATNFDSLKDETTGKVVIAPDGSVEFLAYFTPTALAVTQDILRLLDNDATSDPGISLIGTGVNPIVSLSDSSFTFGNLAVGDTALSSLTVTNTGVNGASIESKLVISSVTLTPNFSIVDDFPPYGRPNKDTLLVGESITYRVRFHPNEQLNFAETISVLSNAGNVPVSLTGSGSQPIMQYGPAYLDYSVVPLGQTDTLEFQVWNKGDVDLVLSDFSVTGTSYSFLQPPDLHIPKNDTLTVPVVFSPTAAGLHQDTLKIETNEPGSSPGSTREVTIYLSGTGTSQTAWQIGEVAGVWTAAGSPYYVVGDIVVPEGQELVIESGVQVRTEGDFKFTVNGTLTALGDSPGAISFTTINVGAEWGGITFLAGSSNSHLRYCELWGSQSTLGGAIAIYNASPTIENCDLHHNTATQGGAVYVNEGAEPHFLGCRFHHNSAQNGGAMYLGWYTKAVLENCQVDSNTASAKGGGLFMAGSMGKVQGTNIFANSATQMGGGAYMGEGAVTEMDADYLHHNSADHGAGLAVQWFTKPYLHNLYLYANTADSSGGGLYLQDGCSPILRQSVIAENNAPLGQAMRSIASAAVINYCTMVGDSGAVPGWVASFCDGDGTLLSNSIVWGVTPGDSTVHALCADGAQINVTYSDVLYNSTFPGLNNKNQDPQFSGTGDILQKYTLQTGSPALNWSDNGQQIGAFGGSSELDWNITLSLVQNPAIPGGLSFVLTSTVPLMSPPYLILSQDLPDTLEYVEVDSGAMAAIAPMIYLKPLLLQQPEYPCRTAITFTNILGADTTLQQDFNAAAMAAEGSYAQIGGLVSARVMDPHDGLWGMMPEIYAAPKPVASGLTGLGQVYEIFASQPEFADGRIEFTLTPDLLAGRSAERCAVARWNAGSWELLPSCLSATQGSLWAPLEKSGTYRLVWGSGISTVVLPERVELAQNFPNPFNPETSIRFAIPEAGLVTLEIYDLMGRKVATLLDGFQASGFHQVRWTGTNAQGAPVSSGVYFYRLQTDGQQILKKMILLR